MHCFSLFYALLGDGNWGKWTINSNCSKPCGGGEQIRKRFCNNPASTNGGLHCLLTDGDGNKISARGTEENSTRICNTNACLGK